MSALTPRAASPRRGIDPLHVQFARARRPRASWQNLGAMLGVNSEDLKAACEGTTIHAPALAPEPPKAILPKRKVEPRRPARAYSDRVQATTHEGKLLLALSSSPRSAEELIEKTRLDRRQIRTLAGTLSTKGHVEGGIRAGGWRLTPKGVAMQAELEAARG